MGGSSSTTEVYQPAAPAAPSTAEAVNAWVQSLPTVFAEQQRQAPLEAQQQLQLLQQYGLPMAEAYKSAQSALYPETTALQEQLAGQASAGMNAQVPEWMRNQYRSDLAANIGTNAGSGIGADYMSRGLLQQQMDYQNYYRDLGLSLAGRQPLSQPTSPQYSNYASNYTPNSVMGYTSQNYGTYAQASRPMTLSSSNTPFNFADLIPSFGLNFGG